MAAAKTAEEWISKGEAAARLGVMTRQLEKRAAQGYIRVHREPRKPTETVARVLYSLADILAIKDGKPNTYPTVQTAPRQIAPVREEPQGVTVREASPVAARGADPFAGLAAHLARLAAAFPPPENTLPGPFVDLKAAVIQTGMPARWLVEEARKGVPWAVNVGRGSREIWRFRIKSQVSTAAPA